MEKTYKILKLLIWILAFAVVIVGASVLYNRLSSEVSLGGLATVAQETAAPEETAVPGETAAETEAQGRNTAGSRAMVNTQNAVPSFFRNASQ